MHRTLTASGFRAASHSGSPHQGASTRPRPCVKNFCRSAKLVRSERIPSRSRVRAWVSSPSCTSASALAGPGGLDPDRVLVDRTERRANDVRWSYIKKGAPVIIEVGPRDAASRTVSYRVRLDHRHVRSVPFAQAAGAITSALAEVHDGLLTQARTRLRDGIRSDLTSFADLRKFFAESRGLVLAPWCGDPECEAALKPLAVSIRCLPEHLEASGDVCIVDGRPRRFSALFGQSY